MDHGAGRQADPGMAATVVDRTLGRRECRIRERTDRYGDPLIFVALLRMEHGRSADRTELEPELCTLIADAHELRGRTRYCVRRRETGKSGKYAPGAFLAGQTVADADSAGLTVDLNTELAAVAGS
jgi:hypothetical protein